MASPVLIVARWNEPEWELPEYDVHVVQKGTNYPEEIPNEGREPASFFWWMWQNRHAVEGERTYCFLQGDPWAHGIVPKNFREVRRYTPLGVYRVECAWDGSPHHPGLPLERLWWKWEISDHKPETLRFVSGGMFLVPGWDILGRSANHYYNMYHEMREEPDAPWCMERFWPYYWRQNG